MQNHLKSLIPVLILALCLAICLPATAKPAGFDAAVSVYNGHQYARALALFQTICKSSPSDASTHYYLGLCYQSLSQQSAAQQEYNWVYTHSTDDTLRYYAYQAMQQLQEWNKHREVAGSQSAAAFKLPARKADFAKHAGVMIGGENIPKGSEFCPFRNAASAK